MQKNIAISLLAAFLCGCLVTGAAGYYGLVEPGIRRARQLESELSAASEYNRVIKAGLDKAASIAGSSDSSLKKLRDILTVLRDTEQMAESGSSSAGSDSGG